MLFQLSLDLFRHYHRFRPPAGTWRDRPVLTDWERAARGGILRGSVSDSIAAICSAPSFTGLRLSLSLSLSLKDKVEV